MVVPYMLEIPVRHLETSRDWYRTVLGWSVLLEDASRQFLLLGPTNDARSLRIALKQRDDPEADRPRSRPRLTLLVDGLDDYRDRLRSLGIDVSIVRSGAPEPYRSITIEDPDAHQLTFFEWTDQGDPMA